MRLAGWPLSAFYMGGRPVLCGVPPNRQRERDRDVARGKLSNKRQLILFRNWFNYGAIEIINIWPFNDDTRLHETTHNRIAIIVIVLFGWDFSHFMISFGKYTINKAIYVSIS